MLSNLSNEIFKKLNKLINVINKDSGKIFSRTITQHIKKHIKARFANSKHWNPNKVTELKSSNLTGGSSVNIAGATRAYHDITIKPKFAKMLSIPLHKSAFGKSPRQFNNLFPVKTKNNLFLAIKNSNNKLAFMYVLKDVVHQKRDKSLLPKDEVLIDASISKIIKHAIQKIGK